MDSYWLLTEERYSDCPTFSQPPPLDIIPVIFFASCKIFFYPLTLFGRKGRLGIMATCTCVVTTKRAVASPIDLSKF